MAKPLMHIPVFGLACFRIFPLLIGFSMEEAFIHA
jgi:hypothetical protein